jgi:hypothetical protein
MKRSRGFWLFAILLFFATVTAWLWWASPRNVDMSTYAPADSLLYLEANQPVQILDAISSTGAWQSLAKMGGAPVSDAHSSYLRGFMRWTGFGPARTVILARAQVAVVISDLRVAEEADTLNIKPEGALLIETHTSERRIRPVVEDALKTLAEQTYGSPTERRVIVNGVQYVEWIAPGASRQIVGAIVGSLAVVGTNEQVVQQCLAVAQSRGAALSRDPELHAMRARLTSDRTLAFGYVPAGNSAKLIAVALPLLLGRAPGDSEFQRLITNGATKIFGRLGWTSNTYMTGIEDHYEINLQPPIMSRLKPTFVSTGVTSQLQQVVPGDVYSATSYRFANPAATWQSLKMAVSSQVDALSTVVFSSLLKSALLSYGIDEPDVFLAAVHEELLTLRLDENSERALLIAHVRDRSTLRKLFERKMKMRAGESGEDKTEVFEDPQEELTASLGDDLLMLGSPADVSRYKELRGTATIMTSEDLKRMIFFGSSPMDATVVTYTNDSNRIRRFISTIVAVRGESSIPYDRLEAMLATLPYSVTETTLTDYGIERINRSPLGQFSSIVPLLFPERPAAIKNNTPAN